MCRLCAYPKHNYLVFKSTGAFCGCHKTNYVNAACFRVSSNVHLINIGKQSGVEANKRVQVFKNRNKFEQGSMCFVVKRV